MTFTFSLTKFLRTFALLLATCVSLCLLGFAGVLLAILLLFRGTASLPADCAIVFGAAVHPVLDEEGRGVGSEAGPGITRRMETAVKLYNTGNIKRLFLTGGKGEGMRRSEAEVMRTLAISNGVSPDDIVMEGAAHNTQENIRFTRPLTSGCSGVVAISDRYHLARIQFLALLQGWNLPTYPAERHATRIFEVRSILREAMAIVYYGLLDE